MQKSNRAPVVIVALLLLVTAMTISSLPKISTTAMPVGGLNSRFDRTNEKLPAAIQDPQPEMVESLSTDRRIPYIPNVVSVDDVLPFIPNVIGPNAVLPYIPNMIPRAVMSKGDALPVDIANGVRELDYLLQSTVTVFYVDGTSITLDQSALKP